MREITLTAWREELGYTIEELAKELDILPAEIRLWERDYSTCPCQRLVELALDGLEAQKALKEEAQEDRVETALDRAHAYLAEVEARNRLDGMTLATVRSIMRDTHTEMARNFSFSTCCWKEGGMWFAECQAPKITVSGATEKAAMANLHEAIEAITRGQNEGWWNKE